MCECLCARRNGYGYGYGYGYVVVFHYLSHLHTALIMHGVYSIRPDKAFMWPAPFLHSKLFGNNYCSARIPNGFYSPWHRLQTEGPTDLCFFIPKTQAKWDE